MNALKPLSLAMLLCAVTAARAEITTYTNRAAFMSVLTAPGTDTFDDLSPEPLAASLMRMAGPYAYRADSGPNSYFYGAGLPGDGWLSTNSLFDTITFSAFSPAVRAVGADFFGSDVAGQWLEGTSVVVSATDGVDTVSYTVYDSMPTSFVGFASTRGMVSVSINTVGTYWPTVNNLTMGQMQAIPEPAEFSMLLAGIATLAWLARRKRA